MTNKLLEQYTSLVEFLGIALGRDYEIVLHDVSSNGYRIAALANGHVSGRNAESPMTDVAKKLIQERAYVQNEYIHNYKGLSKGNKVLDSSTYFIKEEGELVGMMCINYDPSRYLDLSKKISEDIINLINLSDHPPTTSATEPYSPNSEHISDTVEDVVAAVLSKTTEESNIPPERLTFEEKLEVVGKLHEMGVFLLKGAVSEVAKQLHTSEPSVYRYLNKVNAK